MTKQERSWILYDVANSAFVLIMVTTLMPLFFKDIASQGVDNTVSTSNWGYANSMASLILVMLAPFLGTLADYKGAKKRFLTCFMLLGVVFTLLMTLIKPGEWLLCLILFIIARIGFSGANIFYDSLLVDITDKKRMDWISANGYAWGYIGSIIPFLGVIMIIIFDKTEPGAGVPLRAAQKSFFITAFWWLVLSIPVLKNTKQRFFIKPVAQPFQQSFQRLWQTFKEIKKYRQAFLFLIAYFFYIDGVHTIITMASAYGRDIGLSVNILILVMLMIQIIAFPFALIYGKLAGKFTSRKMLFIGISIYTIIVVIAFFLPVLPSVKLRIVVFFILSFMVATSQGGIQALSRSFFSKLIPPEKSGEFFGFYNIFGKLAVVMGPFFMGFIGRLTGQSRFGIISIAVLFIGGALVLWHVREEKIGWKRGKNA